MSKLSLNTVYYKNGLASAESYLGCREGEKHLIRCAFTLPEGGAEYLWLESAKLRLAEGGQGEEAASSCRSIRYALSRDAESFPEEGFGGTLCDILEGKALILETAATEAGQWYLWLYPDYSCHALWELGELSLCADERSFNAPALSLNASLFGSLCHFYVSGFEAGEDYSYTLSTHCLGRESSLSGSSDRRYSTVFPLSLYGPLMPSAESAPLLCRLESRGSYGTLCRQREALLTLPESCAPTVNSGWEIFEYIPAAAAAHISQPVEGYCSLKVDVDESAIDLSAAYGASVSSLCYLIDEESFVPGGGTEHPVNAPVTVTCLVTDSRGRRASASAVFRAGSYTAPALSLVSAYRSNANGDSMEGGSYCAVSANLSYSPFDGENTVTMSCSYREQGGSYGTKYSMTSGRKTVIGSVSASRIYDILIEASDSLGNSVSYECRLPNSKWAMKFMPDGNGVAFGKAADKSQALEIASDWQLRRGEDCGLFLRSEHSLTLASSAWSSGVAEISLSGMKETDRVLLDLNCTSSANAKKQSAAFALIYRAESAANKFILYAQKNPGLDLPLRLVVMST